MSFSLPELYDALNSVITIPIVPYQAGQIDYVGLGNNVDYLLTHNYLDGGRPRVISMAGTSLIHHMEPAEQVRIFDQMGRQMGKDGVLMTAVVPNPWATAKATVEQHLALNRQPDVILIMPLGGIFSPESLYDQLMELGEIYGPQGARFLYYLRNIRELEATVRLLNDSPAFVGVKVGTGVGDVHPLLNGVGENAMVIWGIGDRSTAAAELGTKGHTSGIAVVAARASDEINNAQRRGDWAAARQMEGVVDALEEIRFRNGRAYNYAAVAEALNQLGESSAVGGDGGPFNPPVPGDVAAEVTKALEMLRAYR